ncbi:MAG TPA: undecaprenyldiphospho-muramoylpentapeptide beta-N-acetylglucosaminyltransferase [Clostridia bacterium]
MRILIAGGGTAGHINPGIAIAKKLIERDKSTEVLFIGTKKGLETKLVPREGFTLETIRVKGFIRKLSLDTLVAVKELFQGILDARKIIKNFKPDIVVGTGGYVCGPVVLNASLMGIPTVIHEQNAFPGVTNKLLSRFVDTIAISFKESASFFKNPKKVVFTGNPVRGELLDADRNLSRQKLGLTPEDFLVVIFGGSRGAEKINEAVSDMLLSNYKPGELNIIFATGEAQYEKISSKLKEVKPKSLDVVPYIYDMGNVLPAADLVVCRAGAITLGEIAVLGLPSVIIPSPYVTANHQEHNARSFEEQGAAVVILEKDLNGDILYNQIKSLEKNREQLAKMARNSKKCSIPNAADKITQIIGEALEARKNKH